MSNLDIALLFRRLRRALRGRISGIDLLLRLLLNLLLILLLNSRWLIVQVAEEVLSNNLGTWWQTRLLWHLIALVGGRRLRVLVLWWWTVASSSSGGGCGGRSCSWVLWVIWRLGTISCAAIRSELCLVAGLLLLIGHEAWVWRAVDWHWCSWRYVISAWLALPLIAFSIEIKFYTFFILYKLF